MPAQTETMRHGRGETAEYRNWLVWVIVGLGLNLIVGLLVVAR